MPASSRGGGVTRRCECRDTNGKLLSSKCPKLKSRTHGRPQVRQELPPDADGNRRVFRRTGYDEVKHARADLDKVRQILDLPEADDEDAQHRVGDLLADVMKRRLDIPDPAEVSKRLGVGVPLDGKMTVGEWLDTWLATKRIRKKSLTNYESQVRVHLKPAIGHLRLDRLNVGHLEAMFQAIDDQNEVILAENARRREQVAKARWGLNGRPSDTESARLKVEREKLAEMPPFRRITGASSQQSIRRTLRAALNKAIARQLIDFNAASHVELASGQAATPVLWLDEHVKRWQETGERPSSVMVWTPSQAETFLEAAEAHRLFPLFVLTAFRGPRRGEVVGIDWAGLDLDAATLRYEREIVVDGYTPIETDLKTDKSKATIQLGTFTVHVLCDHQARQQAERAKRLENNKPWEDTGKVFVNEDGSWLHPDKVTEEFRKVYRSAGLPPITFRDLRHLAATLIHAGGGDLHTIKEVLRHSSITLTSNVYTTLLPQVDKEVADASENVVFRRKKPKPEAEEEGSQDGA